jgi:hypothetical protein
MTGPGRAGRDWAGQGWAGSRPELLIGALLVAAVSLAGYAFAGPGAAAAVLIAAAAGALFLLRGIPGWDPPPQPGQDPAAAVVPSLFNGFWRKRSAVAEATKSLGGFDRELRGTLQHLLAARLAERHGISLAADPAAARRLLFPGERAGGLWFWLDPARPDAAADDPRPGIRPRSLAALIGQLERL